MHVALPPILLYYLHCIAPQLILHACHAAEVQASDLLESALSNFGAARKGTAALLHSSLQSRLLTEDKVCLCATKALVADCTSSMFAYSSGKLNVSHVHHR